MNSNSNLHGPPTAMRNLKLMESPNDLKRLFEKRIRERAAYRDRLIILEAGCGRRWPLDLRGIQYELVGVDKDVAALELRKNEVGDLERTVVGDLREIELPVEAFDVIYCSFVLEHVRGAEAVLECFVTWLAPGGIIILRIPERNAAFHFVTRMTPFWLHVLMWRYIDRVPQAGTPGYPPYRTFHDKVVSREGIHEFCTKHNLVVKDEFGDKFRLIRPGRGRFLIRLFVKALYMISFGRLTDRYIALSFVLEKVASAQPTDPADKQ